MQDYHWNRRENQLDYKIPNTPWYYQLIPGSPGYEKEKVDYKEFRDLMERVRAIEEKAGTCPCQDEGKKAELAKADEHFGYKAPVVDELGNIVE